MKRAFAFILLLGLLALPRLGLMEGDDTIRLAKTLYALGKDERYETLLDLGTVVMNRVDSPWFGDTLGEVLSEQHQFPMGSRYDAESLSAAHDVLAGRRTLEAGIVYYQSASAAERRPDPPIKTVGSFAFYATEAEL